VTLSPRRIAVIGRSGAGKTTVALRIAKTVGLPVVHLDREFWGPDWVPVSTDVYAARQSAAIAADAWVIDGSYLASPGWEDRLQRADVVVLVEAPLAVCLWRIIRRALQRRDGRRPDLPDGCQERLSLYHLWWALGWATRFAHLRTIITQTSPNARLLVVRSADQAARILFPMPPDRE
jgi:adenylate kinase family enzyme